MNYCIRYINNSEQLDNVQEVSIIYKDQDRTLVDYLAANYVKRTILRVLDVPKFLENSGPRVLNAIAAQYPQYNFAVCFCFNTPFKLAQAFLNSHPEFKFNWFIDAPITDWDMLHAAIDAGVSDVYICEALGFELPRVHALCSCNKVNVRVYPNVAQSSIKAKGLRSAFFIRPEDIEVYEPYIDVLEFYGPIEKQDVLLHIYRETRTWPYDLSIIILGLSSIENKLIDSSFGTARLRCGKGCLKGDWCSICSRAESLDQMLKEANVDISLWSTH